MPKKSMKNDEACDEDTNQNNFSVTTSKKKYKEDLEGKFDMIIEADDINESEGEQKDKNAEAAALKEAKEETNVDETQDIAVLKEKLASMEKHIDSVETLLESKHQESESLQKEASDC